MRPPRAVVVPLGVPPGGEGLGIGIAALLHGYATVDQGSVLLAQMHPRGEGENRPKGVVEAFVPPDAWPDILANAGLPSDVAFVLTGAFEPPKDGLGQLHLAAFDANAFTSRGRVDVHIEAERAGQGLVSGLRALVESVAGSIEPLADIGDVPWEVLESLLLGERCAVFDPLRGDAHDRRAALMHLERALGEAPSSRFLARRLATLASEIFGAQGLSSPLALAAVRSLERGVGDAPVHAELHETLSLVALRRREFAGAEACAERGIAEATATPGLAVLLAEALRGQGDLNGALRVVREALARDPGDPLLGVQHGVVLAAAGLDDDARERFREVLARHPGQPNAFVQLAERALERRDALLADELVDHALGLRDPPFEVRKFACDLAFAIEPPGLPRAARLVALARPMVAAVPADPSVRMLLARALAESGQRDEAVKNLEEVRTLGPDGPFAAEAERGLLVLRDRGAGLELDAVLRAAQCAELSELEAIAVRARRLAAVHGIWAGELAAGIAERRRGHLAGARGAFERALVLAPGAVVARVELAEVCFEQGDASVARQHAERVLQLDPTMERARELLARVDAPVPMKSVEEVGVVERVRRWVRGG